MDLFNETSLTFVRSGEGDLDDSGKWVTDITSEIKTRGSLQPMDDGEIIKNTPEGMRVKSAFWYLTKTPLQTYDETSQLTPDTTTIKGKKYQVLNVADSTFTTMYDMGHYEYILINEAKRNVN